MARLSAAGVHLQYFEFKNAAISPGQLTLMAMSDTTGSSFAQWADLYNNYGPSNPAGHVSDHYSTSPPTISGSPARPAPPTAGHQQQQQRAGASKTIKKRASRRAPVTLLNTDAASFRAMVQQFTGAPGPFASNDGYAFQVTQPQPPAAPLEHLQYQHRQQYTGAALFGYGNILQQQAALTAEFSSHHGLAIGSAEDRMLLQSLQQAAAAAQMPSRNGANGGYFA